MTSAGSPVGVVACGALARHVADVADERGWPLEVHPLPPLLHNRPERIADAVDAALTRLAPRYRTLFVAYAGCGTHGALDDVLRRHRVGRLAGEHCYDVFAGAARVAAILDEEPGTYLLTDFLARSFSRSVLVELGLDRHPHLRDDYFRHYRRVVWLAQDPDDPELRSAASVAAASIGLPLVVVPVGVTGLHRALSDGGEKLITM